MYGSSYINHQTTSWIERPLVVFSTQISKIIKLGEGTFGEAFKGNDMVLKVVPMAGDFRVNGEIQKSPAEMYAEAAIALQVVPIHRHVKYMFTVVNPNFQTPSLPSASSSSHHV
jgi:hypothetical protein